VLFDARHGSTSERGSQKSRPITRVLESLDFEYPEEKKFAILFILSLILILIV